MKKYAWNLLAVMLAVTFVAGPAHAKKRRHGRRAALKPGDPNPKVTAVVKALMDGFTWGMTKQDVLKELFKRVKKEYEQKMHIAKSQKRKAELFKEMKRKLRDIKKSTITFRGQKTPWNTSIIDDQFAHNNNESMIVYKKKRETYYFFFYNDRLYKIFIALDKKKFMGWNFMKFQHEMSSKFGPALEVFKKGISGMSELHHITWKSPEGVELRAMDKTMVYGTFVFVVIDSSTNAEVLQARADNGAKVPGEQGLQDEDPVINSIMK